MQNLLLLLLLFAIMYYVDFGPNKNVINFVILFSLFVYLSTRTEAFSSSGLALSDDDCDKLASTFWRPKMADPAVRRRYHGRICDKSRRDRIYEDTGNYYMENGKLI